MINEKRFKSLKSLESTGILSFNKLFFSILKDIEKEIFTEDSYRIDTFKLKYGYSVERKETKNGTINPISYIILKRSKINKNNVECIDDYIEFGLKHIKEDDYNIEIITLSTHRSDFVDKRIWKKHPSESIVILMKKYNDYHDWIFRSEYPKKFESKNMFKISRVFCRHFSEKKLFDIAFFYKNKEYMLSHLLHDINIDTKNLCRQDKEINKWPFILEDVLSTSELALLEMALV